MSSFRVLVGWGGGRGEAERGFLGSAGDVEGEQKGEDLVAEGRGPEQAFLVAMVQLGVLAEEHGRGPLGEVIPAIGAQDGEIELVVELAQALDVRRAVSRVVERL